jgi:electron transfer flavoprotein beta subunit
MRVLVPFKRTIDYHLTARPNSGGTAVDLAGVKMTANPFDEIALEEAMRLKEAGLATEVIAVSIGDAAVAETLRTALAMGADRAIHLTATTELTSLAIAENLAVCARREGVGLILMGKQAIDTDAGQVPAMLAELLGWPQANNAFKIALSGSTATVVCEADHGLETLEISLPAVITADLRLNTPRLVSMPQIIKARTKPLVTEAATVAAPAFTRTKVFTPQQTRQNKMLPDVAALASAIREARA